MNNHSLTDVASTHPQTLLVMAMLWVPVLIWTTLIVGWMITADLEVLLGIPALVAALGVGLAGTAGSPELLPYFTFVAYLTLALFPLLKFALNRRELTEVELDAIDSAYEALGQRPTHPALKFRLARALYNRGLVNLAIEVGKKAIGSLPVTAYPEEHRDLAGWHAYIMERSPSTYGCPTCGFGNLPGDVFCQRCGGPFLAAIARGKWHSSATVRKLVSVWTAAVLVIFGTYLAFLELEEVSATIVTLAIVGSAVFVLYQAFVRKEAIA